MKPVIAALPLVLGIGAAAIAVKIQMNPYAFTSGPHSPVPVVESVRVLPFKQPVSIDAPARATQPASVDEVTIVGRARPARPHRTIAPVEPAPIVVPAPCKDGEYRKLDEKRGVKLLCPGGSL
jgi:hypothetical protein